jgi:glycosyltransferase involved in cell wall biosynthesis
MMKERPVHDDIATAALGASAREGAPRVSIGLPVYNAEEYLEESLVSILNQTYADFELIISDNASTDGTATICERYARLDPRIRYTRNTRNIGGTNNQNLTIQRARGEYFRLAAHDDRCAPTLLERLVAELDEHPEVINCSSATVLIGSDGTPFGTSARREATDPRPNRRFREMLAADHLCLATYGLMRRSALAATRLEQNFTSADHVFLAEFALRGQFYLVDEELFYKRKHRGNTWQDPIAQMVWFEPELAVTGRPTFPRWRELFGYVTCITRVPLPWSERALCYVWIGPWVRRKWRALARELGFALVMMVHSKRWRTAYYRRVLEAPVTASEP